MTHHDSSYITQMEFKNERLTAEVERLQAEIVRLEALLERANDPTWPREAECDDEQEMVNVPGRVDNACPECSGMGRRGVLACMACGATGQRRIGDPEQKGPTT